MNFYVYLGMAIAAAALAAVCYLAGRSDGRSLERSVWVGQQNDDLRETNRALDAAHTLNRKVEQEKAQALSEVSASYQKGLKDGDATKASVLADFESGAVRLRVGLTGCEALVGATSQAAASAGRRDGGAATGFLAKPDESFLVSEASRADAIVKRSEERRVGKECRL